MLCQNSIIHTIVAGDTLYSLAIRYNTTVSTLLALNPGIDIYNLQIGSGLIVCPNLRPTPIPPIGELPICPQPENIRELLMFIINWIKQHYGETQYRDIMNGIQII
jgi:hypothetical protein